MGYKRYILMASMITLSVVIFGLALRGLPGNPTPEMLNRLEWRDGGPFELSPERGRFAIVYSVAEDHSFIFSLSVARFVVPDLAINPRGEYVSLFAPTVSLLVLPGYALGKYFGIAQVGTFAVISLFALLNMILIKALVVRFGGRPLAGWLAGFTFVFATPAFAYGVNLYQHHVSTFLILISLYALFRWRGWVSLTLVWFICGLSIAVDNPNFFFMFPIGAYALGRIVFPWRDENGVNIQFRPLYVATFLSIVVPVILLLAYNQSVNGDPFRLSGALPGVPSIGADGRPAQSELSQSLGVEDRGIGQDKNIIDFFGTRELLNGLFIHLMSPDRGVIWYAPTILFGIWGLIRLYGKRSGVASLLVSVLLANLLIYSMWADPWGGWAFGSRYLIPGYAILSIGLGLILHSWKKNVFILVVFMVVFAYSAGVNVLGALTSSANPPQVEILGLEKTTGKIQRYSYDRNWQYLHEKGSKSFIYQIAGKNIMTAPQYYGLVVGLVILGGAVLTGGLIAEGRRDLQTVVKIKKRTA